MCRFLNADDSEILLEDQDNIVGYNIYSYCLNNPITMYDPDGYSATLVLTGGGAVASWLAGLGSANFWNPLGWVLLGCAVAAVAVGTIYYYKEHSKNKSGSNRNKHENGNARRQRDQGGEKKKQKPGWKKR